MEYKKVMSNIELKYELEEAIVAAKLLDYNVKEYGNLSFIRGDKRMYIKFDGEYYCITYSYNELFPPTDFKFSSVEELKKKLIKLI